MVIMDDGGFDRSHYRFQFVRREMLGEVRCLVYDVRPLNDAGPGRFIGRIWVEDQEYNVVRFNGTYGPSTRNTHYTHFDSWRVNCAPHTWLPAYIYSEEASLLTNPGVRPVTFQSAGPAVGISIEIGAPARRIHQHHRGFAAGCER